MKEKAISFYACLGYENPEQAAERLLLGVDLTPLEEHDLYDHLLSPVPWVFEGAPYIPPSDIGEWFAAMSHLIRSGAKLNAFSNNFDSAFEILGVEDLNRYKLAEWFSSVEEHWRTF